MILLADVVMGPIFLFDPFYGLLILILPISIEFGVLLWHKWGTWKRTLADVVVANIVSTIVGIGAMSMLPGNTGGCEVLECMTSLNRWSHLLFLCICSVIIEGAVLKMMYRGKAKPVWKMALLMNVASYVLLSPLFMFFLGD
jgi:hypothetical protein